MGSITSSLDTRAGTGIITITHADLPDGTFELKDIDKLGVDFDVEEDSDNAQSVFFAPSEFTIKVFDRLDTTDADKSLFDYFDNILSTETIQMSLYFETDGGSDWTDLFVFTTNQVSYNRIQRLVTIESILDVSGTSSVSDIMNNYPTGDPGLYKEVIEDSSGNTGFCMPTDKFIEFTLEDSSSGNSYINNSQEFGMFYEVDQQESWVVLTGHSGYKYKQTEDASSMLYRLGAVDGSVVGSLLGYNFFVHRLSQDSDVTLSEDDASELDVELGVHNYRSILTMFNSRLGGVTPAYDTWGMWGSLQGDDDGLNSDAIKTLKVYFFMLGLQPALWDAFDDQFYSQGSAITPASHITTIDFDGEDEIEEGQLLIPVNDSINLSKGDVITFANNAGSPHLVRDYISNSSDSDVIVLDTPLQYTIESGSLKERVYDFVGNYSTIPQKACKAYAHAYGANGSRLIKLTILDIDKLNPYETFTLDSSFPDAVAGSTYRPSSIDYNIMEDKIEIEAYAIS